MSDLRGFYAYHPEPSRIVPREASVKVFSGVQGQKYTTFNFLMYDDDNGILIKLDEIDACPDRDVTYYTHDTEGIIADNRDVRSNKIHQRTPHNTMQGIAIDYMKRNIPLPSDKEAIIAEGTYEEYRSQAEAEQQPRQIKDIINDAPYGSILGLMRCIKEDSDAITRTTDGPTDKKYDWPDDPDHECYHMEEVI